MRDLEDARALAIARLAQELAVPAHLLNLYPPPANHWAQLMPEPRGGWTMTIVSPGRRWGRTRAMEQWREQVWAEMQRRLSGDWSRDIYARWDHQKRYGWNGLWTALYEGTPTPADDEFGDRCHPGAYPCAPPPCPTFDEGWPE